MSPLDFLLQRKPAGLAAKGRKYSIFEGVYLRQYLSDIFQPPVSNFKLPN